MYSIFDTLRDSVVAQHNTSELGSAFAPRSLVQYLISSDYCSVFIIRYKESDWPSFSFLFRMTVRTCFSCTTISVYGIMSKNLMLKRDFLRHFRPHLPHLRVQRYNYSANCQNNQQLFFEKNSTTHPYTLYIIYRTGKGLRHKVIRFGIIRFTRRSFFV